MRQRIYVMDRRCPLTLSRAIQYNNINMKILITGAAGMLGTDAMTIFAKNGFSTTGADLKPPDTSNIIALDITDFESVRNAFGRYEPDIVLHCAAYTNVDGCERNPDDAFKINAFGTGCVACAANEINAALVYISTDFVFDGSKGGSYHEFDAPNPINTYGASKLAGERQALLHCSRSYVVRTSWLYGLNGSNFPYTIMKRAREFGQVAVVSDQVGTPTRTVDLVNSILDIICCPLYGVYHASSSGETSWFEFAKTILEYAGMENVEMEPIDSGECAKRFNTPTKRPPRSVMRNYMLESLGKDCMPDWKDSLKLFIAEAKSTGKIV